jgi:RNA polymerase sigma factor for flagellar operon FliA
MIVDVLPLVAIIAKHMAQRLPPSVTIDELTSAGTIGLIKAASRFDSERGLQFGTYARHRIRGEMLDYLRSLDPLSRGERRAWRQCAACREMSGEPRWVSLEMVLAEVSRIRSNESLADSISRTQIMTARHCLSERENRIIELSFYAGCTNREIARQLGVTEGRISQIRAHALVKLRASLS